MIGPMQYRLNGGTTLTWIQKMKETDWIYDCAQLSFVIRGVQCGSA